jgi:hypothetical protein
MLAIVFRRAFNPMSLGSLRRWFVHQAYKVLVLEVFETGSASRAELVMLQFDCCVTEQELQAKHAAQPVWAIISTMRTVMSHDSCVVNLAWLTVVVKALQKESSFSTYCMHVDMEPSVCRSTSDALAPSAGNNAGQ